MRIQSCPILLFTACLMSGFSLNLTALAQEEPLRVMVIAPSLSTSSEARRVLRDLKWTEAPSYREADGILVVVRSMLFSPLRSSYDCVAELEDDADSQLNISGSNYHVYIYSIEDDLSVREMNHIHYEADN